MRTLRHLSLALVLTPALHCGNADVIMPGPNDHERVQQVLIDAQPGAVIQFGEGTFHFAQGLSLTTNNVTLRGMGEGKTMFSFKDQAVGSQGLLVKADDFTVEDMAFLDTAGDAIKVEGAQGVTFRRTRVEWTRGPDSKNGAYGLYPVQCKRVLIEDCSVSGASDAGIYVGQSDGIIVRRSRAEKNVAGIEIENSMNADVYDNTATGNSGGLLVFDLPGLQFVGGHNVRVYNNRIEANNENNFAPEGNIVGTVPRGTGMLIMANDKIEVFGNTFKDNKTGSLAIISYLLTGLKWDDKKYDPYPESIDIHDNTFDGGGDAPDPTKELSLALAAYFKPTPDVIFDGLLDDKKLDGGKLPEALRLCVRNNMHKGGAFSFAMFDAEHLPTGMPMPNRDLAPYDCTHGPLPKVTLPGVQ